MKTSRDGWSSRVAFLLSALCLIACATKAPGQGQVFFYNHVVGEVTTHIYGPNPSNPALYQFGQGPNDYPSGAQDWTGFTGLLGTGYTAQLWAADGANQPESSLQPATPTTTFQTVAAGAGVVVGEIVGLPGVPGGDVATITLRVWDNRGGTVTSWAMAQADGVALGESPLFNSPPTGLPALPPYLIGLVSFNIYQVPEPSALALLGAGAFLLWLARTGKWV